MTDKVKVQELVSGVIKLHYLCKEGETDDRKLEKELDYIVKLARDLTCGQYSSEDEDKGFFG